jgi:hypothetical protein
MRLSLPVLTPDLALLAAKPEINLESSVFATPVEIFLLGRVVTDAAGVAAWVPNPGAVLPAGGLDLHMSLDDSIAAAAGLPSITLDVDILAVTGPSTAVGSLAIPSWVADQSNTFPIAQAADFVPQGSGNALKLITAVNAVTSVTNIPPNFSVSIYASPAIDNLAEIGFKRNADGAYLNSASVSIPDKYQYAAAVKKGRQKESKLSLDFVHIGSMGGMTRYNGSRISVAVRITKDKAVQTAWVVYTGYRPDSSPNRGDGDGEVVEKSEGPYEGLLIFEAP